MRVLLDEGVPHKVRHTLQEGNSQHSFFTAHNVGLTGDSPEFRDLHPNQRDERLLREAKAQGFDAIVTIDKSMQAEQGNKTPINVVTLDVGRSNKQSFDNIHPLIPELHNTLSDIDSAIKQGKPPIFWTISATQPAEHQQPQPTLEPPDPPAAHQASMLKEPEPAWKAKWQTRFDAKDIPPPPTSSGSHGRSESDDDGK